MAAKTKHIRIRIDPEPLALIMRAARLAQMSVPAFVLDAAATAAERVLARNDKTIMPVDQYDALIASLDTPDEAPKLARIAAGRRRFDRGTDVGMTWT